MRPVSHRTFLPIASNINIVRPRIDLVQIQQYVLSFRSLAPMSDVVLILPRRIVQMVTECASVRGLVRDLLVEASRY